MNEEKYILNNLILLLKNKKENELFVLNNKKICSVAIPYGDITRISNYKCVLTYKSVEAILARDYRYSTENWLLTGFAVTPQKKETTDFISSVSDRYKCYHEFSRFRNHVRAVVSSIDNIRQMFNKINE